MALGLSTLCFLLLQVFLVVKIGQSAPAGAIQPFTYNGNIYLTYSSAAQRDVFLQQVRVIWQNVLQEWQVTNVNIAFLGDQEAAVGASAPNSPIRHKVSYTISGQSVTPVPVDDAKTKFMAALKDSGLVGVQEIPAGGGADSGAASGKSASSSSSSSSSGPKSFRITDTIVLSYTTTVQRDTFLSQVMVMWRNSLNVYISSNVKITFISEADYPDTANKDDHLVKYQITGQSVQSVDIQKTKSEVRQTIIDAHLTGMTLAAGQDAATSTFGNTPLVDSSDSNDIGGGGAASPDAGAQSPDAGAAPADTGKAAAPQQFETTDAVVITYTTTDQRDSFLQQILTIWKTVLSQYQATNVMISFVSEKPATGSSKLVTYKITATYTSSSSGGSQGSQSSSGSSSSSSTTTTTTIDTTTVKTTVHKSIQDANISGVQVLTPDQQKDFDAGNDVTFDNSSSTGTSSDTTGGQPTPGGQTTSGSSDTGRGSDQTSKSTTTFQTTDAVTLTYTTTQQRDDLLQKILDQWKTALGSTVINIQITFVREWSSGSSSSSSTTSSKQIVYKITGQPASPGSPVPSPSTVKTTVHKTIQSAQISGIQTLSDQDQQTFDSSVDNIDNSQGNAKITASGEATSGSGVTPVSGPGVTPSSGSGVTPSSGSDVTSASGSGETPASGGGVTPSLGSGVTPASGSDVTPGSGSGVTPSSGGGVTPSSGSGGTPASGSDVTPASDSGVTPASDSGVTPSSGGGVTPSSGSGVTPASGSDVTPASGSGVTPSSGGGVTPSSDSGVTPSSGSDVTPASGSGVTPASGAGVTPSSGTGSDVTPASGSGVTPASGAGVTPSSGTDVTSGSGVTPSSGGGATGVTQASGSGMTPSSGSDVTPASGSNVTTSSNEGVTPSSGSVVAGGNTSSQSSFRSKSSVILTYKTTQDRDQLLQKVLEQWKTALAKYQLTNIVITFVSEKPSGTDKQVTYRVTADSSSPSTPMTIDKSVKKTIKTTVNTNIGTAKLPGIKPLTGQQLTTFDSSSESSDDSTGSSSKTSSSSSSTTSFKSKSSALLTYKTPAERDQLLQKILEQWKTVLAKYQLTNIMITFVSEKPGTGTGKQVVYRITAQSSSPSAPVTIDKTEKKTIKTTVNQKIETAKLPGIQPLTKQQMTSFESSSDSSDESTETSKTSSSSSKTSSSSSTSSQSTSNTQTGQNTPAFQTTDSVSMSFTNDQQRDDLLQKILDQWKQAFGSAVTNIHITFVTQSPSSGSSSSSSSTTTSKQIVYKITADPMSPVIPIPSPSTVKTIVHKTIQSSQLSGVQPLSDSEQQTFDNSNDNIDNGQSSTPSPSSGVTPAPGVTPASGSDVTPSSGSGVTPASGSDATPASGSGVTPAPGSDVTPASGSGVTPASGSDVTPASGSGVTPASGSDVTPASGSGVTPASGSDVTPGSGSGVTPATGSDVTPGSGSGVTPASGSDVTPGSGSGVTPASGSDVTPASGSGVTPSSGANVTPAPGGQPATGQTGSNTSSTSSSKTSSSSKSAFHTKSSAILTYTTTQQRDQLLQQILAQWKTSLTQYKVVNIMITFVSEKPAGTGKQVVYRITADSSSPDVPVPVDKTQKKVIKTTVDQKIQTAKLPGIQSLTSQQLTTFESSSDSSDDSTGSTSKTSSSSSSQTSFKSKGSALLTYKTPAERDQLLQKILEQWKTVLAKYQLTNIIITFVSEKPGTGTGKQVVYRITAQSSSPSAPVTIDNTEKKTIKTTVNQKIETAKLPGIQPLTKQQMTSFESSSDSSDESTETSKTSGSSSKTSSSSSTSSQSTGQITPGFQTTDAVTMTFTNDKGRDDLLQKILDQWKKALGSSVINIHITFVSQSPSAGSSSTSSSTSTSTSKQVVYKITAEPASPVIPIPSPSTVKIMVHKTIQSAQLSGVQPLSETEQQTFDSSNDNIDNNQSNVPAPKSGDTPAPGVTPASGSDVTPSSGSGVTPAAGSGVTPAPGSDMTPASGSDATPASGSGVTPVSGSDVTPGSGSDVTPASDSGVTPSSGSGMTPASGSDVTPSSGGGVTPASGSNVTPASGSGVTPSSGSGVTPATGSGVTPSSGANVTPAPGGQPATGQTGSNTSSTSSSKTSSSSKSAFHTKSSAILTYTTTQQRDQLLQQILAQWKTSLTQYKVVNIMITFISEKPAGTGKQVVYRITADSSSPDTPVPIDKTQKKVIKTTVNQKIQTAKLPGIQSLTSQQLTTFESSSDSSDESTETSTSTKQTSSTASKQTSGTLQVTDDAMITYKTVTERDTLLQQILTLWISALGGSSKTTLKITFVSEKPAPTAGAKIVTYSIAGFTSSQMNSATQVKNAVHKDIQNSKIAGVQLATTSSTNVSMSSKTSSITASGVPAPKTGSPNSKDTTVQELAELMNLAKRFDLNDEKAVVWIKHLWLLANGKQHCLPVKEVSCP